MIVSRRLTGILFVTVALVAACSSSGAAATTPPAAAGGGNVTVGLGTTPALGQVLTGPNGLTLYAHTGDTATSSTCTGQCATAWPPLFVTGGAQAVGGAGVTGTFASFARGDGLGTQVTFNGRPLYYWQGDKAPGDATGQGIDSFSAATPGAPAGGGSTPAPATYNGGY